MSEPRNEIDDFGFDPIDTELGTRLRAAVPEAGDADAVLRSLRPQLARAKRRRQTGFVAAGAAALALLAGVAFAVSDTAPRGSVNVPPANHSTVTGPNQTDGTQTTAPDPTETERVETESESDGPDSATDATAPSGTPGAGSGSGEGTTPPTIDDDGGNSGPGGGSDDSPDDDKSGSGSDDSPDVDDDNSGSGGSGGSSGSGKSGSTDD